MDLMEIDGVNENSPTSLRTDENIINLTPVSPTSSGEGLPYAPINWPEPGDNWRWKVGKRVANHGHFRDRYLNPPEHLPRPDFSKSKKHGFASKKSVKEYIQTNFQDADVESFFSLFSWKIPSKQLPVNGNVEGPTSSPPLLEETREDSGFDPQSESVVCKAGNSKCCSLVVQAASTVMPCNICCVEPGFCGDCCCILCNKFIDLNYGGYSYIKCEAHVSEGYICGHVAHLNCALRCYLAGTVGGSIGLDAEYFCRLCDSKTDLISHVSGFIQTCESIDSRDEVRKILNVGVCILPGSQKTRAKELLNQIEMAIKKFKRGTSLEDIWKIENSDVAVATCNHNRNN